MTPALKLSTSNGEKVKANANDNDPSSASSDDDNNNNKITNPYNVHLSLQFLISSILLVMMAGFGVGHLSTRLVLAQQHNLGIVLVAMEEDGARALPSPLYAQNKKIPSTIYTSKHFDTGSKAVTSDTLLARRRASVTSVEVNPDGSSSSSSQQKQEDVLKEKVTKKNDTNVVDDDDDDEEHMPAGQHLLIDIRSVDGVFLNSEDRLARAMVDLVEISGLTMLSYHCHGLEPVGVSCVGVLLESHISFHTWPIPGVITLDLFTCGPNSLLPLVPDVKKLFAIPRMSAIPGDVEQPHVQWAHKKRGFRDQAKGYNPEESTDIDQYMVGWIEYDMKELVANVQTEYQLVEIYDVLNPRFRGLDAYKKSLSNDGSYESQHPEFYQPDRVVYLDGIMQSRSYGEAAYHEALVHPALMTHPNPKRVAIIGGGEGATLREVLKHNTIEKVTMIEIDQIMVDVSRKYLPEWSDCSQLQGSAKSCFDDPRTEVFYTDAVRWFVERFADRNKVVDPSEKYDVIIMDALDPGTVVEFSDVLYNDTAFMRSLSNALGDGGIYVAQMGEADYINSPPREYTNKRAELDLIRHLSEQGFQSMKFYTEAHGNFLGIWKFMVAFKNPHDRVYWYSNEAEVNVAMKKRAMPTVINGDNNNTPFHFFDGGLLMAYQYTDRVQETIYCRSEPAPPICDGHGFDPERPNAPLSSFTIGENGQGVISNTDLPKGTYVAIDEAVQDVIIMPTTVWLIEHMAKAGMLPKSKAFEHYFNGHDSVSSFFGGKSVYLNSGIASEMKHGCNGSNNIGAKLAVSEANADPNTIPSEVLSSQLELASSYSIPINRQNYLIRNSIKSLSEDITAGQELFDNFLSYSTAENWQRTLEDIRTQCHDTQSSTVAQE